MQREILRRHRCLQAHRRGVDYAEQLGAYAHDVAGVDEAVRHDAGDGRAEDGIGYLPVGACEARFRVRQLRLGGGDVVSRNVEIPRGERPGLHELFGPLHLTSRDGDLVLGGTERRGGRLPGIVQRACLDAPEQRARLDGLPLLHGDLRDRAPDFGAHRRITLRANLSGNDRAHDDCVALDDHDVLGADAHRSHGGGFTRVFPLGRARRWDQCKTQDADCKYGVRILHFEFRITVLFPH
jgi:hypothetical protein